MIKDNLSACNDCFYSVSLPTHNWANFSLALLKLSILFLDPNQRLATPQTRTVLTESSLAVLHLLFRL